MSGVTVRVPASSANLGPGFDSFGLALSLHNQVAAELSATGTWHVQVVGEGERDSRLLGDNRVTEAMMRLFAEADRPELAARVFCRNAVPVSHGLGSSAAAIVGGLVAANALLGEPFGEEELFETAASLEGHPDNVAAAIAGGFTMCWNDDGPHFARVEPPSGLAAVCVGSRHPLTTTKARDMLPESVPHADAAFNVGRAGLLTAGIALGRRDLAGPGTEDRLHEPYRESAVPDLGAVCDALMNCGADGAALSGSGPTVIGLVFGTDDEDAERRAEQVARDTAKLVAGMEDRLEPQVLRLDREGVVVL